VLILRGHDIVPSRRRFATIIVTNRLYAADRDYYDRMVDLYRISLTTFTPCSHFTTGIPFGGFSGFPLAETSLLISDHRRLLGWLNWFALIVSPLVV
jgi:hypothetical protein